jgi:hypothetical protein
MSGGVGTERRLLVATVCYVEGLLVALVRPAAPVGPRMLLSQGFEAWKVGKDPLFFLISKSWYASLVLSSFISKKQRENADPAESFDSLRPDNNESDVKVRPPFLSSLCLGCSIYVARITNKTYAAFSPT